MVKQTGAEWPSKLQAAVLAANTCWKRSTNYSPFYLMFGREANSEHLLAHTNLVVLDDENKEEELDQTTEIDAFSPEPENQNAWLQPLLDTRAQSQLQARDNIHKEQQLQKLIFDKKVKKNR